MKKLLFGLSVVFLAVGGLTLSMADAVKKPTTKVITGQGTTVIKGQVTSQLRDDPWAGGSGSNVAPEQIKKPTLKKPVAAPKQ